MPFPQSSPQLLPQPFPDPRAGNETDYKHASTPTTGSGVVFFNKTNRAKNMLRAWAEAMAWEGNSRAPDDQVLDYAHEAAAPCVSPPPPEVLDRQRKQGRCISHLMSAVHPP